MKSKKDRNSMIGQIVYFTCGECGDSFGDSNLITLGNLVKQHKDGERARKMGIEPDETWS